MNLTGWSKGLEVTADGVGVVSHAGLAVLRQLADKTGLTGGLSHALASPRLLIHDRGRVTADLACAIADGSEVIRDFRVLTDQKELFGLVASVPTAWRTLAEIAAGGPRAQARIIKAVNAARRQAWAAIEARHGALPGVRIADKVLEGVTCIRLDATVTPAHSDKELAEPNFKGFGLLTELGGCLCSSGGGLSLVPLRSLIMAGLDDLHRDMASLVVPAAGFLQATGGPWDPYRLVDPSGEVVGPVAVSLRDLQAAGRNAATQRSYGMDLLRWFRFCWAIGVPWDQATRCEARDFCRWIQIAAKPVSDRRRAERSDAAGDTAAGVAVIPPARRAANPVTGKPPPSSRYAASTAAHCESVLRQFYDFHLEAGSGPMVNPFPLGRGRRGGRASAHHNPMDAYRDQRSGLFRPRLARRIPRSIPDERFSEPFTQLTSHRDGALVALWVSTGARAAELLGATAGDADAGQQLITVIRKGTRLMQQLPASPDAFVWLRLYQAQMQGLVPGGLDQPLWWTLRRPFRPLTYHAAHRMFTRAAPQVMPEGGGRDVLSSGYWPESLKVLFGDVT